MVLQWSAWWIHGCGMVHAYRAARMSFVYHERWCHHSHGHTCAGSVCTFSFVATIKGMSILRCVKAGSSAAQLWMFLQQLAALPELFHGKGMLSYHSQCFWATILHGGHWTEHSEENNSTVVVVDMFWEQLSSLNINILCKFTWTLTSPHPEHHPTPPHSTPTHPPPGIAGFYIHAWC